MKNKIIITLIFLVLLLVVVDVSMAFPTPRNIVGTINGICFANANISIYGYSIGQIDNPAFLEDSVNVTTDGSGVYGGVVTDDDPGPDGGGAAGLEIRINITNPNCSPTAFGTASMTATNIVNTLDGNISTTFSLTSPANNSVTNDNTTTFTWTNDVISPNYTLLVDDNSDFSSPTVNISSIGTTSHTLVSELSDNTYYWKIEARQGATYVGESGRNNFVVSTGAPIVSSIGPANTTWIGSTTTTLYVNTSSTANCAYATSSPVAFGAKTPFTTTGTALHSTTVTLSSEGSNSFYIQCNGTNGVLNPSDYVHSILRDTTGPDPSGATITINNGAGYSTNTTLNISWTGFTDASSGIAGYYINTTDNSGTVNGQFNVSSPDQLLGVSDGSITVYVWAVDTAGNIGTDASNTITVDTSSPNYGSWSTNPASLTRYSSGTFQVFVSVTDTSALSGLPQLRYGIGNDALTAAADMTSLGGNIYSFNIPEQASPNDWTSRAGENLTFIVNATDIHGFSSNSTQYEFINDQATAPTFDALSNILATQGTQVSITLSGGDIDDDTLVYTSNFTGFTITALNASHSTATWTPTNSDVGVLLVSFTQSDGTFTVNQSITIVVQNVNDDPVLASIGDLSAYEYVRFNYSLNATDVDNDNISFSTNATFFNVGLLTGDISFKPIVTNRGDHLISFTARDGNGGIDQENITLTVGFCGDSVCSATYESCSLCQADCGVCEEDESQGFIISSRNCLGSSVSIQAKELITRGTCESEGVIIDGLEACENISSTTINIEKKLVGTFTQIETLLTDEFGKVTYTPNETGSYRVRYDSTDFDEHAVSFTIRECTSRELEQEQLAQEQESKNTEAPKLPDFEQPGVVQDIVQSSPARKFVYFVLLPMVLILLVIAGATTYYTYGKKQGGNSYTTEVDQLRKQIQERIAKIKAKITGSETYKKAEPYLKETKKEIHSFETALMKYIEPLLIYRKLRIPHYKLQVGAGKEHQLTILSLLAYVFRKESLDSLVEGVVRENKSKPRNLREFAVQCMQFGLVVDYYFSVTQAKDELMTLHKLTKVDKSYPTLVDIKKFVTKGLPVVVSLHMNTLNSKAPKQNFFAIVRGYNQKGFFIADYEFSRQDTTVIPFNLFKKAWEASGYAEIVVVKKKK